MSRYHGYEHQYEPKPARAKQEQDLGQSRPPLHDDLNNGQQQPYYQQPYMSTDHYSSHRGPPPLPRHQMPPRCQPPNNYMPQQSHQPPRGLPPPVQLGVPPPVPPPRGILRPGLPPPVPPPRGILRPGLPPPVQPPRGILLTRPPQPFNHHIPQRGPPLHEPPVFQDRPLQQSGPPLSQVGGPMPRLIGQRPPRFQAPNLPQQPVNQQHAHPGHQRFNVPATHEHQPRLGLSRPMHPPRFNQGQPPLVFTPAESTVQYPQQAIRTNTGPEQCMDNAEPHIQPGKLTENGAYEEMVDEGSIESDMPLPSSDKKMVSTETKPEPEDNQAIEDSSWINSFLSSCTKIPDVLNESDKNVTLTIPAAQALMKEAINLRNDLQQLLEQADPKLGLPYTVDYELIKKRLNEIEKIFSCDEVEALKKRMDKLKSKRAWKRRRKLVKQYEREELEKRREELHKQIDGWRQGLVQKELDNKKMQELKKAADQILSEVRRKLTDMTQSKELLIAFTKLRRVRKEKAETRGQRIPTSSDDTFQEHLHRINSLLDRQMETYKEEERVLEVMMEVENKETETKEKELHWLKEKKKLKGLKRNLHEFLFGETNVLSKRDPLYAHRQYYLSAEQSLEDLVRIRQQWDVFVVAPGTPGASRLPVDWVQPAEPSRPIWASAFRDNSKNDVSGS